MKKYNVRIYLYSFVDFEVEAHDENDAIDGAWNKMDIGLDDVRDQLFDNLVEGASPDVIEIKN